MSEYYINLSIHTGKYKVYRIKEEEAIKIFNNKSEAEEFIRMQEDFVTPIEYNGIKNIQLIDDGEWAIHFEYNKKKYRMASSLFCPEFTEYDNFEEMTKKILKELKEMVDTHQDGGDGLYEIEINK